MSKKKKIGRCYIGVDVGGTKILAALVRPSGKILARSRCSTPRTENPEDVLAALLDMIRSILAEAKLDAKALAAIGVAVPGIVDPVSGHIVVTPNMNLSGFPLAERLQAAFETHIVLGNDVNLGTLGEQWLGAAAMADSAVGIFVGTGIGGGIINERKLVTGHSGAAAEVGHLLMHRDGPLCGCGGRGCLEAFASRTAIERDIRQAVAIGRKTVLTRVVGADLSVIRSSVLKRAIAENDALVKEVVGHAAQILGEACVQIRHLLDPEMIILGGGLVESCKSFILPIVQQAIAADPLMKSQTSGRVVVSTLGDDAVVLGAVALAQQSLGKDPLGRAVKKMKRLPTLGEASQGQIAIDDAVYSQNLLIRADGKIAKLVKGAEKGKNKTAPPAIDVETLKRLCKVNPSILLVGVGFEKKLSLEEDCQKFLHKRGVTFETMPTADLPAAYNALKGRKAAIVCLD